MSQNAEEEVGTEFVFDKDALTLSFWTVLAKIALTAVDAYVQIEVAKAGGYMQNLHHIQQALANIQNQMAGIQLNITRVQAAIQQMPREIRGQIDDATAVDAINISRAISQRLSDYMRPQRLTDRDERVCMQGDLDRLQEQIWRVKGAKGMSGAMLTSPFFGTWLASKTTLEKAWLEAPPGHSHQLDSPWALTFTHDTKREFDEFIQKIDDTEHFFTSWVIPHLPRARKKYKIIAAHNSHYFKELGFGDSRFFWYEIGPDQSLTHCLKGTPPHIPDTCSTVDLNNPNDKSDAIAAYRQAQVDTVEWEAVQNTGAKVGAKRADIAQTFVEPANIWSS